AAGGIRLEQQAQFVQLVQLTPVQLLRAAIADEMPLGDQARGLQAAERFADRSLGDPELTRQLVDGYARIRRNAQRHDVGADQFEDLIDNALRPPDRARRDDIGNRSVGLHETPKRSARNDARWFMQKS